MVERFKHETLQKHEMRRTTVDGKGRVYHTPDGDFPSVTTVLGAALSDAGLRAWRERVGPDEVARTQVQSTGRGTRVHDLAERYLLNHPDWDAGAMPLNLISFEPVRLLLDKHVGRVYGVEHFVWSKRLQTAGSIDLVCEWDGEPAIIDFKTARRSFPDDSDRMRKYLLQTATYAIMASEQTGLNIQRLVVLICPDDMISAKVVKRDRKPIEPAVEAIFSPRNRSRLGIPDVVDTPRRLGTLPLESEAGGSVADLHSGEERVD